MNFGKSIVAVALTMFAVIPLAENGICSSSEESGSIATVTDSIMIPDFHDYEGITVEEGQTFKCLGTTTIGYSILFKGKNGLITAVVPFRDEWGHPTATTWQDSTSLPENTIKIITPIQLRRGAFIMKKGNKYPVISTSPEFYTLLYQVDALSSTIMVSRAYITLIPSEQNKQYTTEKAVETTKEAVEDKSTRNDENQNLVVDDNNIQEQNTEEVTTNDAPTGDIEKTKTENVDDEAKQKDMLKKENNNPVIEKIVQPQHEVIIKPDDTENAHENKEAKIATPEPQALQADTEKNNEKIDILTVIKNPGEFRKKQLHSQVFMVRACPSNVGFYVGVASPDKRSREFSLLVPDDKVQLAIDLFKDVQTNSQVLINYELTNPDSLFNATLIDISKLK